MDSNLTFDNLPDLPQIAQLKTVATRLWGRDGVIAIWLGGSFGTGKADRYSDVDIRIGVTPETLEQWHKPDWDAVFGRPNVHNWSRPIAEDASLHHVLLDNAEMYDVWVQIPEKELHQEPKLILGCKDADLLARLQAPSSEPRLEFEEVVPAKILGALNMYWSNHVKHEKVIHRNLVLMLRDGVYIFSAILLRFKFILATGTDCGNVSFPPMTIHAITPVLTVLQEHYGHDVVDGLSPAEWNQVSAVTAIEKLDAEIASCGRELAKKYQFDYPIELEQAVLKSWANFKQRENF